MRIVENNGQYKITLPKDLVLDKGWRAGDEIRFVEDTEGRIFLKVIPRDNLPRDTRDTRESAAARPAARTARKS